MSISRTLWRIQLVSIRNAGRYDSRMRFAFVFVLPFDLAIGGWSGSQLMTRIAQWQALGPAAVSSGLWSICLLTWSGISFIAALEILQQGLGNDASHLLFTLPIAPTTRFRAQFGMFFINRLWNWIILEVGITGAVMCLKLGWLQALTWLALLQLGVACTVYATMVALMLCARYILPREQAKPRIARSIILVLLVTLAIVAFLHPQWYAFMPHVPSSIAAAASGIYAAKQVLLMPGFASALFALLLLLALGPLARWAGNLYVASFLVTQRWDRSRKAILIPGVGLLSRLLAQQRTLVGALFIKDLLSQSRNFLFWMRLAFILLVLVFFQQLHSLIAAHGFSDTLFAIGYASALALLISLEQAPNALSGEGNRLSLYLTAPLTSTAILRAKLFTFLLPTMVVGLATDLLVGWSMGFSMITTAYSAIVVALIILACIVLPVLGSAWDIHLNLAVEGTIQMVLQEETAITLKRVLLLNLSLVLLALSFLLVWKFPPLFAITALSLLDLAILPGMLQFSRVYLRYLLRKG